MANFVRILGRVRTDFETLYKRVQKFMKSAEWKDGNILPSFMRKESEQLLSNVEKYNLRRDAGLLDN